MKLMSWFEFNSIQLNWNRINWTELIEMKTNGTEMKLNKNSSGPINILSFSLQFLSFSFSIESI